ncbi:uncharacterized protein LOC135141200 [Zophobas morio]|uniref:uncharacterized protein LOC135141200 n=1 Tax=Zophobas morio TaxID=2755281 RepID=UPI003082F24C
MENCFYSSDDELAWGPLTLAEIKKEFQNEPKRLIKRRETDFGHSTSFFTPSTTFCDDKSQHSDKMNSSSGTSAYFTPNESLQQPQKSALSRNDLFLKNLSEAIESDHDTKSDVCSLNIKRDTLINILEGQKGRESDFLEGVQQTLVENTLQELEDTIGGQSEETCEDSEDNIIVISDDSSSETDEEVPLITDVKMEHAYNDLYENDLLEVIEENSEKSTSIDYNQEQLNVSEISHVSSEAGRSDDVNDQENEAVEDNIEKIDNMNLNDRPLNISAVSHCSIESEKNETGSSNFALLDRPTISVTSDESEESEQCDSDTFNDTIEEMKMALRKGLDYTMPGDNSPKSFCESKPKPNGIPKLKKIVKTPNKFDYVQSPIGDYIRKKSPNSENFKLPLKPAKSRFHTPNAKSNLVPTKQFKNIISPVGVYIKNSPCVVLKHNASVKTVSALKSTPETDVIPNNDDGIIFPEVVYKPRKKVVKSVQKEVILPSSLQKMVQEPIITQHECRTQGKTRSEIVQKLEDGNLTVDSSILNPSDVSYINLKQAFIK